MYSLRKLIAVQAVLIIISALFIPNFTSAYTQTEKEIESAQVRGQLFYINETGSLCVVEEGLEVFLRNVHTYATLPSAISDPYGYFSFLTVEPGYYMIEINAQHPADMLYFKYVSEPFRLMAGDVYTKNITISTQRLNAHLVGKVVDDSTPSVAIADAKVILIDKIRNYQAETQTDSNGEFTLTFYNGTYTLVIEGTGEFEKYSYCGEITLAGDGERYAKLDEYPVINWTDNNNTMPVLAISRDGNETTLVYGVDYEISAPTGEIIFKKLNLKNYDEVIAKHYHYLKRGAFDDVNETLVASWKGELEYDLNYTYDVKKYFDLEYSFAGKTNTTTNTVEVWKYNDAYEINQVEEGIGTVKLKILSVQKANLSVGETIWVNYAYKEREKEYQKELIMEWYDPDKPDQYNLSWGHILKGYQIYKDDALTQVVNETTYTFDRLKGILYVTDWRNFPKGTPIYIGHFGTTEREKTDEKVLVSGRTNAGTIQLSKYYIQGQAVDAETKASINNTKITMTLWDMVEKRLLQKTLMDPTLSMSIPESEIHNDFVLLIHPEGYDSYLRTPYRPYPAAARSLHDVPFNKIKDKDKDLINTTITFPNITNWNNISLKKVMKLNWWSYIKGLEYENIGNVRFQIDLNYEPDAEISDAEINNLTNWLENRTPSFVSADISNVISIDNKPYYSKDELTNVIEIEGLREEDSFIDSTNPVYITTVVNCNTTADADIKAGEERYTIKLYVNADTDTTNYTYYLKLPKFYEVIDSDIEPDKVALIGYTNVTIDPLDWSGWVSLTIQNTRNATARAKIIAWNYGDENAKHAYKVEDENYSYIVARYKNITFSAEDSSPDGGSIVWHRWKISGREWSDEIKWAENKTWVSNFSEIFVYDDEINFTVSLEIMDSGGNISRTWNATESRNLTVRVDEVSPSANLRVYFLDGDGEKKIKIWNNTIFVNVGDEIYFNGSESTDKLTYADSWSNEGIIRTYLYIYGDGNRTYENSTEPVKYAYSEDGIYTAVLNITDAVGFTNETNITVFVKPKPSFTMQDEKGNEIRETRERHTVFLNASESIGPTEDTILYLNWSLEHQTKDIKYQNFGRNVTINYTFKLDSIGNWNVTLNVTDKLGNYAEHTKVLYVAMGKRPDLTVGAINFSQPAVEDGAKVTISVNISNCFARLPEESYIAENITVRFYHDRNGDGIADPDELIDITVRYYNGTNVTQQVGENTLSKLGIKEWVIAKIEWVATGAGRNQTIIVNATCANESATTMRDNEAMAEIRVLPAAWTRIATIVGIVVIIGVVLIVVYLWKTGRLRRAPIPREVKEKRERLAVLRKRYEREKERRERERAKRRAKW